MPWIGQARKRNQYIGNIPYDGGLMTPKTIDLRNSGYLHKIRVSHQLGAYYQTAAPTANDPLGFYGGAIRRISLVTNSVGRLYDVSGPMAALISAINNAYEANQAALQPSPNAFVTSGSLGTGAPTVPNDVFNFDIPLSFYMRNKLTPIGLFQTALNSLQVQLTVIYNPLFGPATPIGSGVYAGVAANGLYVPGLSQTQFHQIYFDPIADPQSQPPLGFIHQWTESEYPLTTDGDNDIILPPSNYYLRVIYWVVMGNAAGTALVPAPTGVINFLRLRYGANITPYDESYNAVMQRQAQQYGFNLPQGVMVHDFLTEAMDERDIVNSAATTNLRATINTTAGALATYAAGGVGAYVKVATEQLIPLQVPSPSGAAVQGASSTAGM